MSGQPTAEGIRAAGRRINPVFLNTPLVSHGAADAALGCRLIAKVETLNPIRSFKGRGTDAYVSALADAAEPLVTASAGNFGQGLAFAGVRRGHPVTVFASRAANPLKIDAMRRLGATVVQAGADFDGAKDAGKAHAAATGARFVEDGAERAIAEGAGTIAMELTEAGERPDVFLAPLGNGALLTGVGTWLKHASPTTRVIGIVATGAPAMLTSWQAGRAMETPGAETIADGIAVRVPVAYALEGMRGTVDEVLAVSDEAILDAMIFAQRHYGLMVEPAGAAGLAAVLADPGRFAGRSVATLFCGSNMTDQQIAAWFCR